MKEREFTDNYGHRMKDVLDNSILTRSMWVKTRKCWKPVFRLGEEWLVITNVGHEKIMNSYYPGYPFTEDEIYTEFFEELQEKYPAMKFWVKKLKEQGCADFYYISVLMKYKDIPETESLVLATVYRGEDGTIYSTDVPALRVLNTKWTREKNRKEVINGYRRYVEAFSRDGYRALGRCWSYDDLKELSSIYRDPDSCLKIGSGDTKITDSDLQWLRRHNTNVDTSLVSEYHDWLVEYQRQCTDITDNYFRHKKNWRKIHQRAVKLEHWHVRLNGLRVFLDIPVKDYTNAAEIKKFQSRYAKYKDWQEVRDDLHIYISNDIKVWEKRANALRQCIMSCRYYSKEECILVFIDRDNQPAYTAEIKAGNKIGQFMGNERFSNCRDVPEDARQLLADFLSQYSVM